MFGMNYNDDGFHMDEDFDWGGSPRVPPLMKFDRNERYGNAYGNYRGGYAPSGMSGPMGGYPGQFRPPRPLGPPMDSIPPLGWGGGRFIPRPPMPRQSIEDKATRYLMRCGVPKDSIKNFPRRLLQMFEPEHCGLCSQKFESFADSRLHYVSKNHIQAQRKWLSKQSDGGHRAKEIPLKSRDLYCELCDIQITSKQHADSHYEGRQHRATVEGRREPRNKALTLRNMQQRLQQLIRREKKFLKPIDESKSANAKPKEAKDVPPELYCNICKTAVTCSEQMTSHLNGKRHLGKEKQHILKMMKGELVNSDKKDEAESTAENVEGTKDNAESTAESAEGNKDDEEKGDNKGEEEDFDWGKDSESWEENTAKED